MTVHAAEDCPGGRFVRNAVIFGRILRRHGLGGQPDRIVLFTQALRAIGVERQDDVREAARTLFVRHAEQRATFDRIFDAFWYLLIHPASAEAATRDPRSSLGEGPANRQRDAKAHTALRGAPAAQTPSSLRSLHPQ
jgi:uncharacterized protein with von Willebrand factor type A (vWA) domain